MNDQSQLVPPAPEPEPSGPVAFTGGPSTPSPSWWSRWHHFLIGAVAVIVVLGAAAAALLLVLKPTTTVDKMIPSSVDVYAMASLDPSTTQKLNLLRAVHRFPDTSTDQQINDLLDEAFKDSGLTFSGDVRPWLGGQMAIALQLPKDSGDPPVALLVGSRDDAKARAALAKLQNSKHGKTYQWQTRAYDGVSITVGTPASQSDKAGAYALVDHVVIIANSEDLIHQVIDTDHGRTARLVDSSDFKATLAKLPSDRLALLYVNGRSMVAKLKKQLSDLASPGMRSLLPQGLNGQPIADADALQGVGLVLSAGQDSIVLDVAVKVDASKLSPKARAALLQSGHADRVVAWVPPTADGFWTASNLNQSIQAALDQLGSDPSLKSATDEIGLTGPEGVLPHLTGDAGLEATLDPSMVPAGAIVLATDNAASMQKFFAGILALVAEGQTTAATTTSTYRGVKITTLDYHEPFLAGRWAPSYAVLDGTGIMASSRAELAAIIDAHKDHHSIAADPTYAAASRASLTHPLGIVYLDLARLLATIERAPTLGSGMLESKARANLAPLKAFIVTGTTSQDGVLERIIVFVQ